MPKSELLNQILTDYMVGVPDLSGESAAAVYSFCDYAAQWLAQKPPIGVGHSAAALTLKFVDGRELALCDADDFAVVQSGPSMSITGGTGDRVRVGSSGVADRSLPITGQ